MYLGEKIITHPNVWDLHIHTTIGTKECKYYDDVPTEEFIDKIIEIFDKAPHPIGMVSFTDHNTFNVEAYEIFQQKSKIAIIPGIEIDVYFNQLDIYTKHVIFYFDDKELKEIDKLAQIIKKYIEENEKIYFEPFVLYLLRSGKKFAVSPHAFKQGKRGIDMEWNDEESGRRGVNSFSGLFFPFWEAAGKGDICKAIEYLTSEDCEGKVEFRQSIISFSDSSNYKKLEAYINNPHQFFLCLNSFKGLLLAGSDPDRIIYDYNKRIIENGSEKIKRITLKTNLETKGNQERVNIELSDRLNVVIGGRGKGKSALLDAIMVGIDHKKISDKKRAAFVKKFEVETYDFSDNELQPDTHVLYFSQSYINELFDGNSQDTLVCFFKTEFTGRESISEGIHDIEGIIAGNKKTSTVESVNIADNLNKIRLLKEQGSELRIKTKDPKLISLDLGEQNYANAIRTLLKDTLPAWDKTVEEDLNTFVKNLLEKVCKENYKEFVSAQYNRLVKQRIDDLKKQKSKASKEKTGSEEKIKKKLTHSFTEQLKRIRQINLLYEIPEDMTTLSLNYCRHNGEGSNAFYFTTIVNKEHPVEFARNKIIEAVNGKKVRKMEEKSSEEIFQMYASTNCIEKVLKDSVSIDDLFKEIAEIRGIKHEKILKIIYRDENGRYLDLHNTSPGTQTNAVMEFILHSNSTIPLLIDQPEDNIDNEARYAKLTKWIRDQKYERQLIVVTHDANIVINGDAECVIIADHDTEKFKYEYGALEYGDILDKAAIILDGGKKAIHRRITKYGE